MLESHSGFKSNDPELVRATFFANLGATKFDVPDRTGKYAYKIHWSRHKDVTLVSSASNKASDSRYEPATFLRQYFPVGAGGRLRFNAGKNSAEISGASSSVIVPPDVPLHIDSACGHNIILLRIETASLQRKLESILGVQLSRALEFCETPVWDDPRQLAMRRAVMQFAADLDLSGPDMLPGVRAELEQALVVRFLLSSQHNFSSKLALPAAAPSPSQLRRVTDYIEANWDKPLDIEALAATFELSARSLFRHFKKFRDCSPQDFIKSVRLKNVRAILELSDSDTSVMAVAMRCGFHSLGHFARDYREMFGELPSDTVRRSRSTYKH